MYLYIVVSGNGLFKIGKTSNLRDRMMQIIQSSPVECELLFMKEYSEGNGDLEKTYHDKFAGKRIRGEWFALSRDELLEIVDNEDVRDLVKEMHEWGFFSLGLHELAYGVSKACLYRASALNPRRNLPTYRQRDDRYYQDIARVLNESI